MKQKIMTLSAFFLLFILIGAGCEKEQVIENKLSGAWIEKAPCNDGTCDTLVFNIDNIIEYYKPFIGWSYNFISDDSLSFFNNSDLNFRFKFSIINENEIIIYNFLDQSITNEIKDISFQSITLN